MTYTTNLALQTQHTKILNAVCMIDTGFVKDGVLFVPFAAVCEAINQYRTDRINDSVWVHCEECEKVWYQEWNGEKTPLPTPKCFVGFKTYRKCLEHEAKP